MTDSRGEVMGEEVGSKVASDEHGRTMLGGRGKQKKRERLQKTVCDKDGEDGKRGDVKKLPVAKKVAKRRRPRCAPVKTKSLKNYFFDCFNLLSCVSGGAKRFRAKQIWDSSAHTSTLPV